MEFSSGESRRLLVGEDHGGVIIILAFAYSEPAIRFFEMIGR